MKIVDKVLQQRQAEGNPIKVGIIGAGVMSKGLVNQIHKYTPGMIVAAVYNRTIKNAKSVIQTYGNKNFVVVDSVPLMSSTIKSEKTAVTNELNVLLECPDIDVIVEMATDIKFSLQSILKAFKNGKHVVTFSAELEATFGPYLKAKAKEFNVLYTLGDGDQPGVTQNLYRYVQMMGLEPLVCINVKGLQDHYRNPTTQKGFATQWGITPELVTSFADGTKISFEQAVTANSNGMCVAKRGMIGPEFDGHVDEMKSGFYPDIDQLRKMGGIVDYVVGAKPGPGVFVFATTEDKLSRKYLKYAKMGDGPMYSFYVPYHLLYFELVSSIARLVDFKDITIDAEYGMKVEVITSAKVDLKPGDVIDGLGGYKTYGLCDNTNDARSGNFLPMGLAEGCIVKKALKRDDLITLDDVEFDDTTFLDAYLKQIDYS